MLPGTGWGSGSSSAAEGCGALAGALGIEASAGDGAWTCTAWACAKAAGEHISNSMARWSGRSQRARKRHRARTQAREAFSLWPKGPSFQIGYIWRKVLRFAAFEDTC